MLVMAEFGSGPAQAEAFPAVELVPSCARTGGGIAIAEPDGRIYYCLQRLMAIERRFPGASRFFLLHEVGHIKLQSGDEPRVDCWAASELAHVGNGAGILAAARRFVEGYRLVDPKYGGNGTDRSELLQGCYDEGPDWLSRARASGRRPPARDGWGE